MQSRFTQWLVLPIAALSLPCCGGGGSLSALPSSPTQEYRLDTGDEVRIFVYGIDAINNNYVVNNQGQISLPLVERISAAGKTIPQLESAITNVLLQKKILVSPNVNVQPVKLRPFFILGEVRNPGQYSFIPGMSVLSAISSAGGFTYRANQDKMVLRRKVNGRTIRGHAYDSTAIQPGDTIEVLEKWF